MVANGEQILFFLSCGFGCDDIGWAMGSVEADVGVLLLVKPMVIQALATASLPELVVFCATSKNEK